MRATSPLCILAFAAGCATTPDPDAPARVSCTLDCFYERDVRDWELVGQDLIVIFVGGRRCAYRMDMFTGSDCSVTMMTPYLDFEEVDARICVQDAPYINTGPYGTGPERCRVRRITPLTDDELLELYAEVGARPPLPPIGSGDLSVEEGDGEEAGEGASQPAPPGQGPESAAPPAGEPEPSAGADQARPQASDGNAPEAEILNLSRR